MNIVHSLTDESLESAAKVIRSGGIVIVPTETFYALAANPFDATALRRLLAIKSRDTGKPLALIADSFDSVRRLVAEPSHTAVVLMQRFWPGSLTILLDPLEPLPSAIVGPHGKVGVRVPPPCPARDLASRVGGFITATSANLSGEPDPDLVDRIAPGVREAVELILDLGRTPGDKPSTVVEPVDDSVRVLREGTIPAATIRDVLSAWSNHESRNIPGP